MKKINITLLLVLMTITFACEQTQKATKESGKKIILNSDGTWKYADIVKTLGHSKKANLNYDGNRNTARTVKIIQKKLDPNVCSNWIKTVEDKVTGESITGMKDNLVVSKNGGKDGFAIFLVRAADEGIILNIKAVGAVSCIDEGAKINILFTDGTRRELASNGDFNCEGDATVYFGGSFGKMRELAELQTKEIEIMRVWTSDSYLEEKFEEEEAIQLKNSINCLMK